MMLVVLMGLAAGMCKERPQLMMLVVLMGRAAAALCNPPQHAATQQQCSMLQHRTVCGNELHCGGGRDEQEQLDDLEAVVLHRQAQRSLALQRA